MEDRALVSERLPGRLPDAFLSGAKRPEVLGCARDCIRKELQGIASRWSKSKNYPLHHTVTALVQNNWSKTRLGTLEAL